MWRLYASVSSGMCTYSLLVFVPRSLFHLYIYGAAISQIAWSGISDPGLVPLAMLRALTLLQIYLAQSSSPVAGATIWKSPSGVWCSAHP